MSYAIGNANFNPANMDAFGRLRVSNLNNQFESKFHYGNEEFNYKSTLVTGGSATFLSNESAWSLSTTTASGSRVIRESYRYLQYHPGKSQLIMMTGVFGSAVSNCVKRMGYYDDEDGLFFVQNGTAGFGICRRTSTSGTPVDNITLQGAWNLDKMDGTGPSGVTIDLTKTHIFVIDFQWLGVGAVRFGMVIDGALIYVHQSNHANYLTTVYMKSAWLPLRYEIQNVAAAASGASLKQICSYVSSEGGIEERGTIRTAITPAITTVSSGSWTPLLGIKINTTLNGQKFRGSARMLGVETIVTGNNPCMFMLMEFPTTMTGAVWTAVDAASPASVDFAATAVSGGVERLSFAASAGKAGSSASSPEDILGVGGSICYLMAKGMGGSSSAYGSINWREII